MVTVMMIIIISGDNGGYSVTMENSSTSSR